MLVETAADILEALAGQMRRIEEPSRGDWGAADAGADAYGPQDSARARTDVLEALSFTPIHRDEILRDVDAPAGLVIDILLDLVLSGSAEEHSGGRFSLKA